MPRFEVDMTESEAASAVNIRKGMRRQITLLFAIEILGRPNFPSAHLLPRIERQAYTHIEHQVLLNYRKLARILWGTVLEMCEVAVRIRAKNRWWPQAAALVICLCCGSLRFALDQGAFFALALIALPLTYAYCRARRERANDEKIRSEFARIKFGNIECLMQQLDGEEPSDQLSVDRYTKEVSESEQSWAQAGDGKISPHSAAVLVAIHQSDPFPGYGRLQARQTFVFRPSAEKAPSPHGSADDEVWKSLHAAPAEIGLDALFVGKVVVIDGSSILMDSAWLEKDRRPRLRCDPVGAHEVDPRADVRTYIALEALFPRYSTSATFFVRTFPVGNSLVCEICICTLGPPLWGLGEAMVAMSRYKKKPQGDSHTASIEAESLKKLRDTMNKTKDKPPADTEEDPNPFWVDRASVDPNWRELHSLSMASGYFDGNECRVFVRTLYDRLSRSVLAAVERAGYDTDDYKDSAGKFVINAEKIEQMIVGTNVYSETNGKSEKASGETADNPQKVDGRQRDQHA
jgi:hypothetical protein